MPTNQTDDIVEADPLTDVPSDAAESEPDAADPEVTDTELTATDAGATEAGPDVADPDVADPEVVAEAEVADAGADVADADLGETDDTGAGGEPPEPTDPEPPPVMIGEPWFFPNRIMVVKAAPDPDDISAHSVDHHVVSRPSKLGKRWQVAVLSSVVIVVLVALMVTGGRALRSGGVSTRPKVPAPAGVPSDWIAYRDPNSVFLIWHPPTWTVDRSGTSTDFTDPSTDTRLRVDHGDPVPAPEQRQWLDAEAAFAPTHPDYVRLQISPSTYGGAPAAVWEYSYSAGGVALHAAALGFSTTKNGYTLAFQAPARDWEQLLSLFTAFKTSFRIPPGQ